MQQLLASLHEELNKRANLDLQRQLHPRHGLDFSSNDYLGLSSHQAIIDAVISNAKKYGYGATSSRFIRGEHESYQALEKKLAVFVNAEGSLLFSSGYMANIGALSALIKKSDVVFSDHYNHASIIDGLKLSKGAIKIFRHNDVEHLLELIAATPSHQQKFLVTESLFSMDGDTAPLEHYADLCKKHDIALIIDESHALGLYGHNYAGLISHFGIDDSVLLSINGLGKAFGCYGGFVAGKRVVIDYLTQKSRSLMFTTALPPLALAAIDAALSLIIDGHLQEKLWHNVSYLSQALTTSGLIEERKFLSPIVPLVLGDNARALSIAHHLKQAGFDIRAIRPPTVPEGTARLRITSHASHSQPDMDRLIGHLRHSLS